MTFWEFILGKYQSQAQSTEETGKYCKNPEVIKRRKIIEIYPPEIYPISEVTLLPGQLWKEFPSHLPGKDRFFNDA